MVKRTPFYEFHVNNKAKIVQFAGFEMPMQFSSIIEEHINVRNNVGVFDISHMGNIYVRGEDSEKFLQYMITNDIAKLKENKVQYTVMCYEDGGIVDDLLVYRLGEKEFMLVVNASNIDKDYEWLMSHKQGSIIIENLSDQTAAIAVQGPKSLATLQKMTSIDLNELEYYTFRKCEVAGYEMIISRTGYTGELGFELFFDANRIRPMEIWNSVFDNGKEFNIQPVGLGSRDTLRLEMGYCLYGNDIDKTTNPLEAGLSWITKLDKEDFIGKKVLSKIKVEGIKRKLVGFTLKDKILARHGYKISYNDEIIGEVTSGTFSPSLQKGIGMGYVKLNYKDPGTSIAILAKDRLTLATIVKFPFYTKN